MTFKVFDFAWNISVCKTMEIRNEMKRASERAMWNREEDRDDKNGWLVLKWTWVKFNDCINERKNDFEHSDVTCLCT